MGNRDDHHSPDSKKLRATYKQLTMSIGDEKGIVLIFRNNTGTFKHLIFWYDANWNYIETMTSQQFIEYFLNQPFNPSKVAGRRIPITCKM